MLYGTTVVAQEAEPAPDQDKIVIVATPMIGWEHNELKAPMSPAGPTTLTDDALEYGLFAMIAHPNFVVNNFLFYTEVNDADVWGDLLFANYYVSSTARFTWNFGGGYLYHEIKPEQVKITVTDPMLKTGPMIRVPSWHLSLNPWFGYAWERVDSEMPAGPMGATVTIKEKNDSYLYGITASYRWRMIEGSVMYYYQDSLGLDEDFQVLRARLNTFFTRTWGLSTRFDYAEHQTTDDTSILVGPIAVF